jgi:hypothetical protein
VANAINSLNSLQLWFTTVTKFVATAHACFSTLGTHEWVYFDTTVIYTCKIFITLAHGLMSRENLVIPTGIK